MKGKPKTNDTFERRSFLFEVRAEETERGNIITGRPIVYDTITDLGYCKEVIAKGALDNADLKDVRFLVNHNTSMIPLARSRNNNANSTMQLTVTDEGLDITVLLDTENNAEAKALWSAVKRQDVSGMSFMFTCRRHEWLDLDQEISTRRVLEISRLIEVSAVTFPAYPTTEIHARSNDTLDSVKRELESARAEMRKSLDSDNLELLKLKAKAMSI